MSQTYVKTRQRRQVAQPRIATLLQQTKYIAQTHEPIVIFSREMVANNAAYAFV